MSIKHLARQLSILVFSILFSCQSTMDGNGPHFANGIKNGWADQNSIVLWTRLTQDKLAHFKGEPFIEIPVGKMKSLAENQDLEGIYNTQIPDGLSLKDMEGYCPGSEGQVLLKYINMEILPTKKLWIGDQLIPKKISPINGNLRV